MLCIPDELTGCFVKDCSKTGFLAIEIPPAEFLSFGFRLSLKLSPENISAFWFCLDNAKLSAAFLAAIESDIFNFAMWFW